MPTVVADDPQVVVADIGPTSSIATIVYPIALTQIKELETKYGALTIGGLDDRSGFLAVDDARKDVKRHRTAVERRRKELNEDAIAWQRKVNSTAKALSAPLETLEEQLEAKQKVITDERLRLEQEAAEKLKAEKAALLKRRMDSLAAFHGYRPPLEVEAMSDQEFADCLAQTEFVYVSELQKSIALKQQQADEAERQRLESERLAEQRQQLEQERQELLKAQQEQRDRIAAEQREVEAEKALLVEAEMTRAAEAERLRHEQQRQEQERLEIEQREAAAEAARLREEALAPDRAKLIRLAAQIETFPIPALGDASAELLPRINLVLCVAGDKIRQMAQTLS